MADIVGRESEDREEDHSPGVGRGPEVVRYEGPGYAWTLDGAQVALRVDAALFSHECVLKAAYKFTDRCYVLLQRDETCPDIVWVVVSAKSASVADPRPLIGEFMNELIDQRVRESLGREFGAVQTLIVAQAFAEGNLLDPQRDTGDYHADPHGAGKRR